MAWREDAATQGRRGARREREQLLGRERAQRGVVGAAPRVARQAARQARRERRVRQHPRRGAPGQREASERTPARPGRKRPEPGHQAAEQRVRGEARRRRAQQQPEPAQRGPRPRCHAEAARERRQHLPAREPRERPPRVPLHVPEAALELGPQALARNRSEGPARERGRERTPTARLEPEAQARGEARGAQRSRRIVVKAALVQHAQPAAREVLASAHAVDQGRAPGARHPVQRNRERVHAEVAAPEILLERARRDRRQCARPRVGLAARTGEVEIAARREHARGAEALVRHAALIARCGLSREPQRRLREARLPRLDEQIHVEQRPAEQQVAHRAAYQQHAEAEPIAGAADALQQRAQLGRQCAPRRAGVRAPHEARPEPRGWCASTSSRRRRRLTCV